LTEWEDKSCFDLLVPEVTLVLTYMCLR